VKLLLLRPSRGSADNLHNDFVLKLALRLKSEGHSFAKEDESQSPGMLAHSRELLLSTLADYACDWGLWLDTDVYFSVDRVLAMMRRPEDVIVWAYPTRLSFDPDYPPEHRIGLAARYRAMSTRMWTVGPVMRDGRIARSEDGQLVELAQAGFGAVLMRPRVARMMCDVFGPPQVHSDYLPGGGVAVRKVHRAFDRHHYPHPPISEDVGFWRRYRKLGGRVWCDPTAYVSNGSTGGCYADEIDKCERLMALAMPSFFYAG
jgi:hypothetical protein